MASRNHGLSRKAKSVASKSTPRSSARERAGEQRGRKGGRRRRRRGPCPGRMSRSELHGPVACGPHDDRRQRAMAARRRTAVRIESPARPRALRGAVRLAHRGHEVLGDARPDGDHRAPRGDLARRRPARHVDVPGRVARRADLPSVAADGSARAPCSTAPTEGMAAVGECIVEVMAAEGMHVDPDDVLVTTGGQQVIDLVCKTLIDPGDVIVAEAPTYPGAVPAFSAYQADVVQIEMDDDGMRIDELEETLDRLEREGRRPKFIYTIPNFQNPAGVTMSLPRRRRLVRGRPRARAARARGQPLRPAALRGRRRCRRCARSTAATSSSTWARSRRSSPPACASAGRSRPRPVLEKMNLGKQGSRPVLLVAVAALRRRVLRRGPLGGLPRRRCASSTAAGATRCSTRWPSTCRPRPTWTHPAGRPVHLGDAARLHRHDRPAGPRAVAQRRLRARAAPRTSTAAAARRCG